VSSLNWEKADVGCFYEQTRLLLAPIRERTVTAVTLYGCEAPGVPAGLGATELFIDVTYEAILQL